MPHEIVCTAELVENGYKALEIAAETAITFLQTLDARPANARLSGDALRTRLDCGLNDYGLSADRVIEELIEDVSGGIMGSPSGRFFAGVVGGAVPAALAADWLTSTWDQNGAAAARTPAGAMIEEIAGKWIQQLLTLPPDVSFAFTTGCQMAHVTCLAAARHALLTRTGWKVEEHGLYSAFPISLLTSTAHHGSIVRAMRLLGMGTRHITQIATGTNGRIELSSLDAVLSNNAGKCTIVVLQAGDLHTGAFDEFQKAIPLARQYPNVWVHIDGAFGLWARVSNKYNHLLTGVELADSWAFDGHKWLNVPFDCGYAFIRDKVAHHASMAWDAPYVVDDSRVREPIHWTPEWSRRCRGFVTYAAIRELGRNGIAAIVDNCSTLTEELINRLSMLAGVEVVRRPELNQALVRFLDPRGTNHDMRTLAIIERINASGEAVFSSSMWQGMRVMRISICNWRTTHEHINRAVEAIATILQETA